MAEHGLNAPFSAVVWRAARADKLITVLLLFILLTTATAGVSAVLTGPDWASLWESLLLGLLLGWLLAIIRWPAWRSALVLVGLGLLFSLLFAGGLGSKILAWLGELFRLAGQTMRSISVTHIDFTGLRGASAQAYAATMVVVERVYTWLKDLFTGQPAFDPVAAGIVWSAVVWLVAAWSGWVVEAGRNALLAVLPALLMNLSTLSYGHYYTASLYLILGITLLLIAVVQFDHRQQEWRQHRVAFPARKNRQVGNLALYIVIALVILSAFISSLSLRQIIDWTSKLRSSSSLPESSLAKSLGIIPATPSLPDAFSDLRAPGLPRDLLIGSGPELSGEQVMSVEVPDLSSLLHDRQLPPLYWRSFTYDIYTAHGWSTSATQQSRYQAGQSLHSGQLPDHQLVQQVFRPLPGTGGTAYAAGEPVEISIASTAAWRSSNDLFGIQTGGTGYVVQSLIPVASEEQLRKAGQAYPRWVLQRYLALPAEVPLRVKQLAIQLTATEPAPYDRAKAIEQYLRQTYPYTLDVPRPPADQDLVDYFLFQLRQGYCDYFASAMVVLARAAGIPARLAIGYASGTYNLNSGLFIVTKADAHSWVEVYFPTIGWVPFEPTAGLPPINRSGQAAQAATPSPAAPPPPPSDTASTGNLNKLVGYIILGVIFVAGCSWAVFNELSLGRLPPQALASEVYRRLKHYAMHLSTRLEGGETPYEFAALLNQRITQIATQAGVVTMGMNTARDIQGLVQNIVHLSYNPGIAATGDGRQIVWQWRATRWRLRLVWLLKGWHKMIQPISGRPAASSEQSGAHAG